MDGFEVGREEEPLTQELRVRGKGLAQGDLQRQDQGIFVAGFSRFFGGTSIFEGEGGR